MSDQSRRKILKTLVAGGGVIAAGKSVPESWIKPVVESVVLPAHAQLSPCGDATFIRVNSLFIENQGEGRAIAILDNSQNQLADECCGNSGDIIIQASSLSAGIYRIVGGSDGTIDHTVDITTECGTIRVSAPTTDSCDNLIATVILPDGIVEEENGQTGFGECDA